MVQVLNDLLPRRLILSGGSSPPDTSSSLFPFSGVSNPLGEMGEVAAHIDVAGQLADIPGGRTGKFRMCGTDKHPQPDVAEIHQLRVLDVSEIRGIGEDPIERLPAFQQRGIPAREVHLAALSRDEPLRYVPIHSTIHEQIPSGSSGVGYFHRCARPVRIPPPEFGLGIRYPRRIFSGGYRPINAQDSSWPKVPDAVEDGFAEGEQAFGDGTRVAGEIDHEAGLSHAGRGAGKDGRGNFRET